MCRRVWGKLASWGPSISPIAADPLLGERRVFPGGDFSWLSAQRMRWLPQDSCCFRSTPNEWAGNYQTLQLLGAVGADAVAIARTQPNRQLALWPRPAVACGARIRWEINQMGIGKQRIFLAIGCLGNHCYVLLNFILLANFRPSYEINIWRIPHEMCCQNGKLLWRFSTVLSEWNRYVGRRMKYGSMFSETISQGKLYQSFRTTFFDTDKFDLLYK